MHATPHAVLIPCALGVAYDGQCGQAWCVKWLPHSMHEKIATGFSDGEHSCLLQETCSMHVSGRTYDLIIYCYSKFSTTEL